MKTRFTPILAIVLAFLVFLAGCASPLRYDGPYNQSVNLPVAYRSPLNADFLVPDDKYCPAQFHIVAWPRRVKIDKPLEYNAFRYVIDDKQNVIYFVTADNCVAVGLGFDNYSVDIR